MAKEQYGDPTISWLRLLQPSIDMCTNGVTVAFSLAGALRSSKFSILNDPGLRCASDIRKDFFLHIISKNDLSYSEVFINPSTGDVWQEGDVYKCLQLAETFKKLAGNPDNFYTGETAQKLIDDLTDLGGKMTMDDLAGYKCKISEHFKCICSF
jgi:gamma-glutamyltranspeptidase